MFNSYNNLNQIAAHLTATFPNLNSVNPLSVLGEGFHSLVVETKGGVVFRIGKNQVAMAGYAKETRILPFLLHHVPVLIPEPQWYYNFSANFPFGVMGYSKLAGKPLTSELTAYPNIKQIAKEVAGFLLALHSLSPAQLEILDLPPSNPGIEQEVLRDDVLPILADTLSSAEYRTVVQWWDALLFDPKMARYKTVLQHGDLWYENLLIDNKLEHLIGVIDFEEAAVGDIAQDFATQLYLGKAFAAQVISSYQQLGGQLDDNFEYRMQKLFELREFGGLQFAILFEDEIEFNDSIRKIRHSTIF